MPLIEVKNLVKKYKIMEKEDGLIGYLKNLIKPKYKEFTAVNNINFNINEGELVGYIGENGAGKSTTIKMLTGLLTPTSGQVIVDGIVPNEKRIENNKNIGAVFGQKTQLWWYFPVIESFRLIKKMYKIPENEYRKNLKQFTELLQLEDLLEKQVKNLSLGQKMRCEIAATFLHNPKIVYLDEPTIGLDVLVKENIRKFIRDINKEKNTTVILTTHDLKDIEDVCDRIILLDKGQIIFDGEKQKFKDTYGNSVSAEIILKNKKASITENLYNEDFEIIEENEKNIKIKFDHEKMTIVNIAGWNFKQVLLLYGITLIAIGISDLCFDSLYDIGPKYIRDGEFDKILLRPVHPLISIIGSSKAFTSIGYLGLGLFITIKMLIELSIPITFFLILKIVLFSIIGAAITGAILTIFSIASFWTYKSNEVIWTFYRIHTFAQYPIDIYNGFIKILITVILPFAFVAYYPTINYLGMDKYMIYLSPIIMIILWIIAIRVWNWALNKYRSTGS